MAVTPLSIICLEEISFPALESVSINLMFFTSNIISLLLTYLATMPCTIQKKIEIKTRMKNNLSKK